jgi:surface antigen
LFKAKLSARLIIIWTIITLLETGLLWHCAILEVGEEIDSFKGVPVFYNGTDYEQSHGQNYSPDGYYYGYRWQCVEYVKRYYYLVKDHRMPDVMGHAKDFFDPHTPQGKLNQRRGLVQYRNGGWVKPQVDDLIVFTDTKYGHVAIVTEVTPDSVEIIQQNVLNKPRQSLKLQIKAGHYYLGTGKQPAGWLRKE